MSMKPRDRAKTFMRVDMPGPAKQPAAQKPKLPEPAVEKPTVQRDAGGALLRTLLEGKYRVVDILGSGGMGCVYLARHEKLDRTYAVKVILLESVSMDPHMQKTIRERFEREAMAGAKIGHPNTVDVFDCGKTPDGDLFIAMEHLKGKDLGDLIREKAPLPWDAAKPIALQVCAALQAAHDKKVIHRDIKPANIFLIEQDGKSVVKVLDFGLAKLVDDRPFRKDLTVVNSFMGTPHYVAPEQAIGGICDHRVDVYSFGIVMYEMLTGSVPFDSFASKQDQFVLELTSMHQNDPPPSFASKKAGLKLPAGAERIVMQALAKNPNDRFQSMREMEKAIEACDFPKIRRLADERVLGEGEHPAGTSDLSVMRSFQSAHAATHIRRSGSGRVSSAIKTVLVAGAILVAGAGAWYLLSQKGCVTDGQEVADASVPGHDASVDAKKPPKDAKAKKAKRKPGRSDERRPKPVKAETKAPVLEKADTTLPQKDTAKAPESGEKAAPAEKQEGEGKAKDPEEKGNDKAPKEKEEPASDNSE